MAVATEVDDLEKYISNLEDESRRCQQQIASFENDLADTKVAVGRFVSIEKMCRDAIKEVRTNEVSSLEDYKLGIKHLHNCEDSFLKHKISISQLVSKIEAFRKRLPIIQKDIKDAKTALSKWGVVLEFKI